MTESYASAAAPFGLVCGMASWLGVSQAQSGSISIDSTGEWAPKYIQAHVKVFGGSVQVLESCILFSGA